MGCLSHRPRRERFRLSYWKYFELLDSSARESPDAVFRFSYTCTNICIYHIDIFILILRLRLNIAHIDRLDIQIEILSDSHSHSH